MALFLRGKTYWYTGTIQGKRVRKSTGCQDKTAADQWVKEMTPATTAKSKQALEATMADILHKGEMIPLIDAFDIFLNSYNRKRPKKNIVRIKRSIWEDFTAYVDDTHPLTNRVDQVTPEQAEGYILHLTNKGRFIKSAAYERNGKIVKTNNKFDNIAASTINTTIVHLKSIFAMLCKKTESENPFDDMENLKSDKEPRQAFTLAELKTIHDGADPFVKQLFYIGIHTGLRAGDICTLKWGEVDLKDKIILRKMRKTTNPVRIPILPALYQFLMELPKDNEYVLPDHAEMYLKNASGISWRVKKCLKNLDIQTTVKVAGRDRVASVKDVHSLRHTFCYIAAIAGVPLPVIQSIVGHMDQEMTQMYASHVNDADAKRAMLNMPATFGEIQATQPKDEILALLQEKDLDKCRKELIALVEAL